MFCGVHLRRNLSDSADDKETFSWLKLTDETHKYLKAILWEILKKEENPAVRKVLSELVGEIASTAINIRIKGKPACGEEAKKWDGFMIKVWELLSSNVLAWIENALRILSTLFKCCNDEFDSHKEELALVFKQTFEHPELKIKLGTFEAFSSYLQTVTVSSCKSFLELVPLLLTNLLYLIDQDENIVSGLILVGF